MAPTKLWIGGTSNFTKSYFNTFGPDTKSAKDGGCVDGGGNSDNDADWVIIGLEQQKPIWLPPKSKYIPCDLIKLASLYYKYENKFKSKSKSKHLKGKNHSKKNDDEKADHSSDANKHEDYLHHILPPECISSIRHIVVSVRPPLNSYKTHSMIWKHCSSLLKGIQLLLDHILSSLSIPFLSSSSSSSSPSSKDIINHDSVCQIIHISSIAAIDHIKEQHLRSHNEKDPNGKDLYYPYDRFKKCTEELIDQIAIPYNNTAATINRSSSAATKTRSSTMSFSASSSSSRSPFVQYTNLRVGAIFSDSPTCIQFQALAVQRRIASDVNNAIDANSGRNISILLHLILRRKYTNHNHIMKDQDERQHHLRPVYYYTRPLHLPQPIPYATLVVWYHQANDIKYVIWIPIIIWRLFVTCFHIITLALGHCIPFLHSIDYLLQVTKEEHTFDLEAVRTDFPSLIEEEETMLDCFRRHRLLYS